jgi:hypothetical protein
LHDLMRAFDTVGPGRLVDPGDAGTITVEMWGQICSVITAGASEARTLAQPTRPGLLAAVVHDTDGGDFDLTVTGGYNRDGDTAINFADAKDFVVFYSIKAGTSCYWRVLAQEGTDAAIEEGTFDTLTATTLTATTLKLAVSAVAAAGSAQGEGGNLSAGLNVVSAADNTKVVDLPSAAAGTVVVVVSATVGKTLPIYPASGESIDNASANNAITLAAATAYTSAILVADNATHWVSVLGDTA